MCKQNSNPVAFFVLLSFFFTKILQWNFLNVTKNMTVHKYGQFKIVVISVQYLLKKKKIEETSEIMFNNE